MAVMQLFYDYECPFCARGYAYLKELLDKYPGIKVEYIPVEAHPRPEDHPPHTDLCCQAFYIARDLGADMEAFHDVMFREVSGTWRNVEDKAVLLDIVREVVDPDRFLEILESDKYAKRVEENNDLAYEHEGVWAVPAFRMDGRKLDAAEGVGVTFEQVEAFLKG